MKTRESLELTTAELAGLKRLARLTRSTTIETLVQSKMLTA